MEKRREFSQGGICHLICEYDLPDLPRSKAGARMERTLVRMADAVFASAAQMLPALAAQYEQNSDPHKNLRHRPMLLTMALACEEERCFYRVYICLCLSRCGRTLEKKEGAARFDKQSGHLLGRAKFNF